MRMQGNKQVTRAAVEFYGPDRAKFLGRSDYEHIVSTVAADLLLSLGKCCGRQGIDANCAA